jgi:hypothetical protein
MSNVLPMIHIVTCSRKSGRAITHMGGGDKEPWLISIATAIQGIESGTWRFYVRSAGRPQLLVVVARPDGSKFLKCSRDGNEPTGLLNLPDCPPGWGGLQ